MSKKPPTTKSAAKKASKSSKAAKSLTKAQMIQRIAEQANVSKADAAGVMDALAAEVCAELKAGRPALIPGVAKATVRVKPPTQERMGTNPFTKEPMLFKAKPAQKVVRLRPLKNLRDLAC
jgi:nucleoid DNA-binding protein